MELGSSAAWLETRDNGQKAKQETPQEWECLLAQRTVGQWIRSPVISEYGGKDPKNQLQLANLEAEKQTSFPPEFSYQPMKYILLTKR